MVCRKQAQFSSPSISFTSWICSEKNICGYEHWEKKSCNSFTQFVNFFCWFLNWQRLLLKALFFLRKNCRFAVFGLGSSVYPHFCNFARQIDNGLRRLNAAAILPMQTGDEINGQDQSFKKWASEVFNATCKEFEMATDIAAATDALAGSDSSWSKGSVRMSFFDDPGLDVQAGTIQQDIYKMNHTFGIMFSFAWRTLFILTFVHSNLFNLIVSIIHTYYSVSVCSFISKQKDGASSLSSYFRFKYENIKPTFRTFTSETTMETGNEDEDYFKIFISLKIGSLCFFL